MFSKKVKINYKTFSIGQFSFREEKDFNNVLVSLLRKIAGTEWQISPFKRGDQITLQSMGNALGLDKYTDQLIYHDKRLISQDNISFSIYSGICLFLIAAAFIAAMLMFNTLSLYLRALFIMVLFLYLFVSMGIAFRISQIVTLRFYSDSLSIRRCMYIIIELARCQSLLTAFEKKKLLGHIDSLEKATHSLTNQYNLSVKTKEWATRHLMQIESFIQEREKWIIAPRESTLEDLQQDFYNLVIMYISGELGNFEYQTEVETPNDKSNNNMRNFLIGITRVVIGILIPVLGLLIIAIQPNLVVNFIDIKVLTLICIGWFLLAIDALLKLGIVSSVIGIAKGIKDLAK